jgi:hypothetical protein
MTTKSKPTVQTLVSEVAEKVKEMGGGEQRIGSLSALSKECGARSPFDFMVELGETLERVGLQLTSAPGDPDDLYAGPG